MSQLFGLPRKIKPAPELSHLSMDVLGQAVKENSGRIMESRKKIRNHEKIFKYPVTMIALRKTKSFRVSRYINRKHSIFEYQQEKSPVASEKKTDSTNDDSFHHSENIERNQHKESSDNVKIIKYQQEKSPAASVRKVENKEQEKRRSEESTDLQVQMIFDEILGEKHNRINRCISPINDDLFHHSEIIKRNQHKESSDNVKIIKYQQSAVASEKKADSLHHSENIQGRRIKKRIVVTKIKTAENIEPQNEKVSEMLDEKLKRLKSSFGEKPEEESKKNIKNNNNIKKLTKHSNKTKRCSSPIDDTNNIRKKQKLSSNVESTQSNRIQPQKTNNCEQYLEKLMKPIWYKEKFLGSLERPLKSIADISSLVDSVLSWRFVAVDSHNSEEVSRTFYMSRGRCDVLMLNKEKNSWEAITNIKLDMPAETIVYGEIVTEYSGEENKIKSKQSFHIIDAIILGGEDVRQLPLEDRNNMCQEFANSITKSQSANESNTITIRCKQLHYLTDVDQFLSSLAKPKMDNGFIMGSIKINKDQFYIPSGIMMLNEVRSDHLKCYSRINRKVYFINKTTKVKKFKEDLMLEEVTSSFKDTFIHRLVWNIEDQQQISSSLTTNKLTHLLYRDDIMKFMKNNLKQFNIT